MSLLDSADAIFNGVVNKAILWILAASGLILVADAVGFLHPKIQDWVNRNRLRETLKLLGELGIDIPAVRRDNIVGKLERVSAPVLKDRVSERLNSTKINHPVSIGSRNRVPGTHFFDLMGGTADARMAEVFARDVVAFWAQLVEQRKIVETKIDFVVTPKSGSPILGSEVAKLMGVPLLLHNPEPKFSSDPADPRAVFDCLTLPESGSRGLSIDDSSTGGTKAIKLVEDVRVQGWAVNDFLVVFEPMLKKANQGNAAPRLASKNVTLHSILLT